MMAAITVAVATICQNVVIAVVAGRLFFPVASVVAAEAAAAVVDLVASEVEASAALVVVALAVVVLVGVGDFAQKQIAVSFDRLSLIMKNIFISLIILFVLVSCKTSDEYDYVVEDKVYKCWKEDAQDRGRDFDKGINDVESVLIKHSLLKGRSGADYLEYCKQYSDFEKVKELFTRTLVEELKVALTNYPLNVKCNDLKIMDTAMLRGSKMNKMLVMFDAVEAAGDISAEAIGASLANTFSARDLDHKLYKHTVITTTAFMLATGGLYVEIPYFEIPYEDQAEYSPSTEDSILDVFLTAEGRILIDSIEVALRDVRGSVILFLKEKAARESIDIDSLGMRDALLGYVKLGNERGASYKPYVKVYKEITGAYTELREEYSMEIYGRLFSDLNKNEKKKITRLVPFRLIEPEPELPY